MFCTARVQDHRLFERNCKRRAKSTGTNDCDSHALAPFLPDPNIDALWVSSGMRGLADRPMPSGARSDICSIPAAAIIAALSVQRDRGGARNAVFAAAEAVSNKDRIVMFAATPPATQNVGTDGDSAR
mmetsp:Transcript_28742/g.54486  ORF Transcript_28742/g.54486 Transcript_28742/m.54486 type:complete len:128 (+) Transcript_28742:3232-3615(+)